MGKVKIVSRKRIDGLDAAKFLLILGVVLIHCNYLPNVDGTQMPVAATDTILFFSKALAGGCVPAFFIISGFLFYRNTVTLKPSARIKKFGTKLRSRVHTLLIPYLLWNLIAATILPLKVYCFGMPGFDVFTPEGFSLLHFLKGFWVLQGRYPYDFSLWFLRNLIVFCALAPLLFYLVRSHLVMLALMAFTLITGDNLFYCVYFLMGGWLGCYDPALRYVTDRKVGCLSLFLCIGSAMVLNSVPFGHFGVSLIEMLRNLTLVPASLWLGSFFAERRPWVKLLLSSTFFIYAFHALYCTVARKGLIGIIGINSTGAALAVYFGTFLLLACSSILVYCAMRRWLPGLTNLLTGARMS